MTDDMEAVALRHGKVLARSVAKLMKEQLAARDATITALSKRIAELESHSEAEANRVDGIRAQIANLRRGIEEEKNVRVQ